MKAYLAGNASRDNDDLHAIESLIKLVRGVTRDLLQPKRVKLITPHSRPHTRTLLGLSMWLTSAATPGAPRIS